ncbi:4929_t:CDS:10 [Ambispora leptoticha]|uniref:Chloride channel protein n=1 Tax=Ambispora leptoticha TaxID=144679 RepID=A0A9N9D3V6_9GLOM|nr:4929_t:CDS:10 [Ambispora leptoticha]
MEEHQELSSLTSTPTSDSETPLTRDIRAGSSRVDINRDFISPDESRRTSLAFENNAQTFDQLTQTAAELLKSKLADIDDDFTFKRKHSEPSSSRFFKLSAPPVRKKQTHSTGHVSSTLRRHDDEEFQDVTEWTMEGTGIRVAYDDFTTIDWIHDFAKERARQKKLRQKEGWRSKINIIFDLMEGWIVVLAVGLASGILAGMIDITSAWLSDLKEGYCSSAFYLNRKFCCWDDQACSEWVTWNKGLQAKSSLSEFWTNYVFYVVFSTLFASVAAYIVQTYSPYSAGSGIPEVKTILGGFVIRKFLGWWTLLIKSIGISLVVASNLCLGKEGPLIHLACCCGNIIPRIFPKFRYNEAKKREILSAAASAGVSVAFGAPIGGVLFSLEEVSYYFPFRTMWRSFFCAMVAAVALEYMNPFRTGKLVLFQVVYDREWHAFELLFFAFLGIMGGLYGAFFIRFNLKVASIRKETWLRFFGVQEVIIVALLTSIISYLNIFMRVNPSELVAALFRECVEGDYHNLCNHDNFFMTAISLIIAAIFKFFLTGITFGLKVPAGVWLPSMAIGACFGRAVGLSVQAWQRTHPKFWMFASCKPDVPCVTPGMYAMIGAASAFGGVTRMTVSLVVIMFELTGALTYVLPIMIAVMISKWVGDAFDKEGIYDAWIRLNEYPYLDSKEEYIYNTLASQVMTRIEDLIVITSTGHTIASLDELLTDTDYKGFPVVINSRDMLLIGYISRSELRYAIEKARTTQGISSSSPCYFSNNLPILDSNAFIDFRPWMDQTPITVSHKFPMETVIELFRKMGLRYVLVTKNGQLLGLITKKDVLRHLAVMKHPSLLDGDEAYETQNLMVLPERRMSSYNGDFGID